MLKISYDNQSDIPAGYEALYTEKDGKFVLSEVEGLRSDADFNRVNEALRKERNDHKQAKESLSSVMSVLNTSGVEVADLASVLDRVGELGDAKDLDAKIEARLKTRVAPLERTINELTAQRDALQGQNAEYVQERTTRTIRDEVTRAAQASGIRDSNVIEDILMYADREFELSEDNAVLTRDNMVDPTVWLSGMKEKRAYWWPTSGGGGAQGGKASPGVGANPFTAAGWNVTAQMQLAQSNPERAKQMAAAAGTTLGGGKPSK